MERGGILNRVGVVSLRTTGIVFYACPEFKKIRERTLLRLAIVKTTDKLFFAIVGVLVKSTSVLSVVGKPSVWATNITHYMKSIICRMKLWRCL